MSKPKQRFKTYHLTVLGTVFFDWSVDVDDGVLNLRPPDPKTKIVVQIWQCEHDEVQIRFMLSDRQIILPIQFKVGDARVFEGQLRAALEQLKVKVDEELDPLWRARNCARFVEEDK